MSVEQLLAFYQRHRQFLEDYCADHRFDCDALAHVCKNRPCRWDHHSAIHRPGASADIGLSDLALTMHVVVDLVIKPLTAVDGGTLGYAPLYNRHAPLRASVFISHCWGDLFADFVHTLGEHLPHTTTVWICSFALPQNGDIGQLVTECELEHSPFARALTQADRMLVVVDQRILPLERIWCLFEMYVCTRDRIPLDVRAPVMSKTLFRDIRRKVHDVDIRKCKSTSEDDRQRILQAVRGFEVQVNRTIQQSVDLLVRLMESVKE